MSEIRNQNKSPVSHRVAQPANPVILKREHLQLCHVIILLLLLEESFSLKSKLLLPAEGKMKPIICFINSAKKHNFMLLRGTGEQEFTTNNLLLQIFVTANLSPRLIKMVTT